MSGNEGNKPAASADVPKPADAPKEKPADAVKPEDNKDSSVPDAKPSIDEKPPGDSTSGEKPADSKDQPPQLPDAYDLKLPENSPLSESYVQSVGEYAKANKLTKEQAQKLLDREHDAARAGVQSLHEQAKNLSEQWLKEAQADKEIGGEKFKETVVLANTALDKLFPGIEIRKVMETSGLGNHPSIIKGFARIGRMLSDDKIESSGKPVPKKVPMKDKMYDHPTSKQN